MEVVLTPQQAILYTLLILIAVFVVGIFFRILIKKLFSPQRDYKHKKIVQKKWKEVEELVGMNNTNGFKLAVLEADKLLDYSLKALLLPGDNLGQRLKVAVARYPQIRPVWRAHLLRNKIAHDTYFELRKKEARQAIRQFQQTLKYLGFL